MSSPMLGDRLRGWRRRLRALLHRRAAERELARELAFHLEMETAQLVRAGMTPDEARRAARLAFGGVDRYAEEVRDVRNIDWLEDLGHDLRHAARGLRRSPGLSIAAILSLSFGIGSTTTLFSAIDALDFRPLPFRDQGQLVWLAELSPPADEQCPGCPVQTSDAMAATWFAGSRSLDATAAMEWTEYSRGAGDMVERLPARRATPHFLRFLGMAPALGREFLDDDTTGTAHDVALISYDFWQREFGGRQDVVGMLLRPSSERGADPAAAVTIVGVLPEEFRYFGDAEIWLPLRLDARDRSRYTVAAFGRLRPGVARSEANAELGVVAARLQRQFPRAYEGWGTTVQPLRAYVDNGAERGRYVLFAITGLVLLIAVLNVASLLLSRAVARQAELALRSALGASSYRLAGQLIAEGTLLGLAGGAGGVLLTYWSLPFVARWLAIDATGVVPSVDRRVLLFALGLSVFVSAVAGLVPAIRAIRAGLGANLRTRTIGAGSGGSGGAQLLVAGQVAVALVVLAAATLLSADFLRARYLDVGFRPAGLFSTGIALRSADEASPESWRSVVASVQRRIAALPEVASVSAEHISAMHPELVYADGQGATPDGVEPVVHAVDADYFGTWGTPIVAGRSFTKSDGRGSTPVAIVNRSLARAFWPGQRALGRRLVLADSGRPNEVLTVVGVVPNIERGQMAQRHWPIVYRPLEQGIVYHPAGELAIRLRRSTPQAVAAVAAIIREETGQLADPLDSEQQGLEGRLSDPRSNAMIIDLFGVFGLLLATMGIYASVAQSVSRRTREVGIRLALGEPRTSLLGRLAGDGMRTVLGGVVVGLIGTLWVARSLASVRQEFATPSVWLMVLAGAVMLAATFVAVMIPARRAASLDPVVTLRAD